MKTGIDKAVISAGVSYHFNPDYVVSYDAADIETLQRSFDEAVRKMSDRLNDPWQQFQDAPAKLPSLRLHPLSLVLNNGA